MSPAKKMADVDYFEYKDLPVYLDKSKEIVELLKSMNNQQLKKLWKCSDEITLENINRLERMDLESGLSPAIFCYDGIAFKYLSADIFEQPQLDYLQKNLRILSGMYGILKPFDGVRPYRLEMQANLKINGKNNLYEYWSDLLYRDLKDESGIVINLASEEYSKCISKYLRDTDRFITISFVEEVKGKLVTKGTIAKMARGEMVRYMAENLIDNVDDIKKFNRLGFVYRQELSNNEEFVFERMK